MEEEQQHTIEGIDNGANAARSFLGSAEEQLLLQERLIAVDAKKDFKALALSGRILLLVILVSVLMGIAAWAFLASLNFATKYRDAHRWTFFLLPVVSVGTAWIYKNHGLGSKRGNNLIIDAALKPQLVHARMAVLTFVCSTLTHFVGGSVGREGAAVQMGGTIASNVSNKFNLTKHENHNVMLAGISSAFGGVFGAPIAGAFFGMEMCFIGKIDYSAAIYCLVASFVGNATSRFMGAEFEVFTIGAVPDITPKSIVVTIFAAIAFGLLARLFATAVHFMKDFYARVFNNYLLAAFVSSLVLLAFYFITQTWRYAGLSSWISTAAFAGTTTIKDTFFKFCTTVLSLGAGLQGGEVTPLFGMGASLGGWISQLTDIDPTFMAALGMLGVFCGGLNVPITTIMLSVDMFGGAGIQFFVIVAFVSYIASGHHGVYQAQRIISPKRRTLVTDEGETVAEAIEHRRELTEEQKEAIEQSVQSSGL